MNILLVTFFLLQSCDDCKRNEECLKAMEILDQAEHRYEGTDQAYKGNRSIRQFGNAAGPALLCKLHKTDDKTLRAVIIDCLGEIKYKPSFPDLKRIALSGEDSRARSYAIESLFEIDPTESESLIIGLKDSEKQWYIRILIAKLLGEYKSDSAAEALKALLNDSSSEVRRAAAWSLCTNQGAASIQTLENAADKETDPGVKSLIKEIVVLLRQ